MQYAFPSLTIGADKLKAQGSFASNQAKFLEPNPQASEKLTRLLEDNKVGVVAHFYMDAEVQGLLSSSHWPHIHISDSLVMADRALEMAKQGMKAIVVLGVDFMSENVRAVMDVSGYAHIPVYRLSEKTIGCSLAEAAEADHYDAYLTEAQASENPLHVIYINTSLRTKAKASYKVPTITCTSSNVVPLILQAANQVEDLSVWFGPDTYMGQNLQTYFKTLSALKDEEIQQLHPDHNTQTLRALLKRFHFFEQGTCIVHHMFGEQVTSIVENKYKEAFITAHLEVPGEMFRLGLEAQRNNKGVVGSTSQILGFISNKLKAHLQAQQKGQVQTQQKGQVQNKTLQFILGTESGMVTSIVRKVQSMLRENEDLAEGTEVEIIFPVAQEAISQTSENDLPIVPGVQSGEGCSTAGGCATCPYMKMNSFSALIEVLEKIGEENSDLTSFEPVRYNEKIGDTSLTELGTESILAMRSYQKEGFLPDKLTARICAHPQNS